MTEQLSLSFATRPAQPPARRDVRAVYDVLASVPGMWWTLWGIQHEVHRRTGTFYDTTSISARKRDLCRLGYPVDRRPRRGAKGCEYRLVIEPPIPNVVKDLPYKIRSVRK